MRQTLITSVSACLFALGTKAKFRAILNLTVLKEKQNETVMFYNQPRLWVDATENGLIRCGMTKAC